MRIGMVLNLIPKNIPFWDGLHTNISEYMLRYHFGLRHICFRKASSKRHVSATRWDTMLEPLVNHMFAHIK